MLHGINEKGHCTCSQGAKCQSSGKHPIYTGWEAKASTCEADIHKEFQKHPIANIGFATGGDYFVLDIDNKHGGQDSLKPYAKLKETISVRTGSGGSHHYYKMPKGIKVPNKVAILPGVDIRSEGGLVVAPGSKHVSGGSYEWVQGYSPNEVEMTAADDWLIDIIKGSRKKKSIPNEVSKVIEEGSRLSLIHI